MTAEHARAPETAEQLRYFPQQLRAVAAPLGPVLVLAGPGAGKTRCLTGRIGHLIATLGASPARICAITFTNKAAQEIRTRLQQELGAEVADQLTLGTIHSLCLDLLRSFWHRVGLPNNFGVADEVQQRLILSRLGVHSKRHRTLLTLFGRRRLQNYALCADDEALFWRYQQELRSAYLIDFDEILELACKELESSAAERAVFQARWDHILIDEFQDLDMTQYAVVRLLSEKHRSLFVVGDDEQSIFSWRGADPKVLYRFLDDFAIAEPVLLDVNFRCSKAIFELARRILPPCELFTKEITAIRETTFPVRASGSLTELDEVDWVLADLCADLAESGLPRGEYAVLYRRHEIGQLFEEALISAGISCQLGKGQALCDDPIIGQVLASLRVVLHPDSELEVECLAGRRFSEALLTEIARMPGASFLARVRSYAEQKAGPDSRACWKFIYQVENLRGLGRLQGGLRDVVEAVLAQGLGTYDNPLEKNQAAHEDPEEVPAARALGTALLTALEQHRTVFLTPAHGLELPIKVMLLRTLPRLAVRYLDPAVTVAADDVVLVLSERTAPPAGKIFRLEDAERSRVTQVFQALQFVESRQYRKILSDYVAFDTETTGKEIDSCEVIELAGVKVADGCLLDSFHALIRPGCTVSAGAAQVHGYTDADLVGQPSFAEVWPRFREFVGSLVQVAHNGHLFDIPVLRRQAEPLGGLTDMAYLDTLTLARSLYPTGRLALVDLAMRFGVPTGRSHHALDDSRCLAAVFEHLQRERLRRSRQTCLANLLDCVALGLAIENRSTCGPLEAALREAAATRVLGQGSALVDAYLEEAEAAGAQYLPLQELLERGDPRTWKRRRRDGSPPTYYPDAYARLFRLIARVKATEMQAALREFLDMVALSRSDGTGIEPGCVSLLTFHATKGLEFSRVYIVGVEDNQIPGYYPLTEGLTEEIHESRRLLYVAMTRAKDRLTLSYCHERNGKPSGGTKFLDELGLIPKKARVAGNV